MVIEIGAGVGVLLFLIGCSLGERRAPEVRDYVAERNAAEWEARKAAEAEAARRAPRERREAKKARRAAEKAAHRAIYHPTDRSSARR